MSAAGRSTNTVAPRSVCASSRNIYFMISHSAIPGNHRALPLYATLPCVILSEHIGTQIARFEGDVLDAADWECKLSGCLSSEYWALSAWTWMPTSTPSTHISPRQSMLEQPTITSTSQNNDEKNQSSVNVYLCPEKNDLNLSVVSDSWVLLMWCSVLCLRVCCDYGCVVITSVLCLRVCCAYGCVVLTGVLCSVV